MVVVSLIVAGTFIVLLILSIVLTLSFFILAVVFKIVGKKKENRKMKIAGNVFLVLGILFAVPLLALIIYFVFNANFSEVTLPDGKTEYVAEQDIRAMNSYIKNPDENSLNALEKLLDKNSALVFYHDINRRSILDYGLRKGNADIVRIALEHGAIFDNPIRYEHMAYVENSMEDYLVSCVRRPITEDDLEIVEMMFEKNASTELEKDHQRRCGYCSNMFGEAVWAVLYNDESVTDTELEFLQVFMDHGLSSDSTLLLIEELPVGYGVSSDYHDDVTRDSNYDRLMEIIGK